jgi:uncharacterized peroxidase-related enzyme
MGKTKVLLDGVRAKVGMTPKLIRTLANGPAALQAYLSFIDAMNDSSLPARLRGQVALTVAQANNCPYCLAAHTAMGKMVGLSKEETLDSRRSLSVDAKTRAVLAFARQMVERRGWVEDETFKALREAGYDDGQITDLTALVALNMFTTYFNHVAGTEVDFPPAPELTMEEAG